MSKTIAIHQPNYLPWEGYFHKIAHSDVFVFLDDVQFIKQSLTRRVHIRQSKRVQEKAYLIVPLRRHHQLTNVNQLYINHSQDWQSRQLGQVYNTYCTAPFFESVYPQFEHWLKQSSAFEMLADYNIYLVERVCKLFNISTQFIRSSSLPVSGKNQDYIINIVRYLHGTRYLSGNGARKYQSQNAFKNKGLDLIYSDFQPTCYPQLQGNWLPGLSILDRLMNVTHSSNTFL